MTIKNAADLHVHSCLSDADPDLTPDVVAAQATKAGLTHLAITDHDYLLPLELCLDLSEKHGIDMIPGCEFSALWKEPSSGKPVIVHVGGHWLDPSDPVLQQILAHNQSLDYRAYVQEMLYRYNKLLPSEQRIDVDQAFEEIKAVHPQAFHRGKRDVVRFLVSSGRASNARVAYNHLAFGGAAHVAPEEMLPFAPFEEVVQAVTRRSLCTLNHLYYSHLSTNGNQALLRCFINQGGQCLETFYSPYSDCKQANLLTACTDHGLLPNCGSDRHDSTQPFLAGSNVVFLALQQRQLEQYGSLYTER